jgi:membrane protease YdiL (CAAX protease family)
MTSVTGVTGMLLATCGAIAAVLWVAEYAARHWMPSLGPAIGANAMIAAALYAASKDPRGPAGLGLVVSHHTARGTPLWGSLTREAVIAVTVIAVLVPLFVPVFLWLHPPLHAFRFRVPPMLAEQLATQLLVVALPEEMFFRGYVQTRCTDIFPATRRVLGVSLSAPALVMQSTLFALMHLIATPSPERLLVWFPGLLFGWLRAWRGGVAAAVLVHAASNLYSQILFAGWFG